MGLLNPILLGLGVGIAVPLLLHLLQRQHGPRVVFPALRYLRRAEKESARRVRVRQLFLMLLRMAAVLLVALAAARPFLRADGVGHSPTAVVIVLDNSMSSAVVEGEARVLDALQARALSMLEGAGADDTFWLLRAGSPGEPALAGDAARTALRVRETVPTAAAADLPAALAHARALLAAGAAGRAAEIHLLTDLQATSFAAPLPDDGTAPPIIAWHPGTAPPSNRAVADVSIGGGLAPVAGERSTAAATIVGDGTEPVAVRLVLDGVLTAAAEAVAGTSALLTLPPLPAGFVAGRVEIDADALPLDNVRHFAVRVLPPPVVALIGDAPFVDDAVDVLAGAGRVRRGAPGVADVVIHAAGTGLETGAATPTVVILPPTSPEELPAANRRLAAAGIGWRFGPPLPGEARLAEPLADPLLRGLPGIRIRTAYRLVQEAGSTDSVLLRLADGAPWAVRGERRTGGTFVLLGSPLSAEASTIPVSAAMLPLTDRLTGSWAAARPASTDFAPGTVVVLPPGTEAVVAPDGTREPAAAGVEYRLGDQPGTWLALAQDSTIAAYSVNAPAAASDLGRLDRRGLQQRLPGWTLHATTDAAAWQRNVFRERLGREVWRPLLLALLLLLLVESAAAAAGRGSAATGSPATGSPATGSPATGSPATGSTPTGSPPPPARAETGGPATEPG
jgi:hypothetical protein